MISGHTNGISSSKPLVNIGVIGFGHRLRRVLRRVVAGAGGRVRVAAVYDPAQEPVSAAREGFGSGVAICSTEDELFAFPGLDWVFIGSPNHLHATQIVKAVEAGLDVFCEKPLATRFEDCLVVRDRLKATGQVFAFGLVLRYSPFYQEIKRIVEKGSIGSIISFEFNETLDFDHGGGRIFSTWRRNFDLAGSHLLEKCCHDLDIASWLIGSVPVQVGSFGGLDFFKPENGGRAEEVGRSPEGRLAYSAWVRAPDVVDPFSAGASIVDNQVAILQYANGVRATFHTNCNTALRERRFYLCGTEGTLHADAYTGMIEWRRIGYDTEVHSCNPIAGDGTGHAGGDEIMAENLVAAMCEGAPLLTNVNDGIRACVTAFAIDEAMEKRQIVDLSEMWEKCGVLSDISTPQPAWHSTSPALGFSEKAIPVSSAT